MKRLYRIWCALGAVTLLYQAACVNLPGSSEPLKALAVLPISEPVKAGYFDVNIHSFDGTRLRATIYQPALAPEETAPVVIHTHGFGVFRMSSPVSLYGKLVYPGEAALAAWKQGYWVVSYDQRGHGDSSDKIHIMDPDYEVRDLSEVIDWIERNVPRLAYRDDDPLVGMIGESYGGGVQLMGAARDSRIDAIIPVTTWNDLGTALSPNGVPKSGWLTTLVVTANMLNPGRIDPILNTAYRQARKGRIEDETIEYLDDHGIRYWCEQGKLPQADTLMIQGFRDVLFPINEAVRTYACLMETGRDIRFIGSQDGHLLPLTQFSWLPGYRMDQTIHCGDKALDTIDMVIDWFDEKLKGKTGRADHIPKLCLTHNYDSGTVFDAFPVGGELFGFEPIELNSGFAGLFEFPMGWWDRFLDIPRLRPAIVMRDQVEEQGGTFRPAFTPLTIIRRESAIAGIPLGEFEISLSEEVASAQEDPVVFVGVGIRRINGHYTEHVSDQVTPLRGVGRKIVELAGVSAKLYPGDVLGLILSTYSDQYRFSGSGWLTRVEVAGSVQLPLHDLSKDNLILQANL